jgi:hypothetical protein
MTLVCIKFSEISENAEINGHKFWKCQIRKFLAGLSKVAGHQQVAISPPAATFAAAYFPLQMILCSVPCLEICPSDKRFCPSFK